MGLVILRGTPKSVGRNGVAAQRRIGDAGTALLCIEAAICLDIGRFVGELVVLDLLAEPAGVVPRLEVMLPGAIVDTLGDAAGTS